MALLFGSGVSLKGPKGDPGTAGAAGTQIYQATGLPDSTLGVAGDYYLATDTGVLYQKTASGWPSSGTMLRGAKGDMGVTGVSGASFLSGSGNPSGITFPTAPNNGDLYLDLAAGEIYKYADGAWADQGYSIKGPAGQAGQNGQDGLRGSQIYTGTGAPNIANYPSAAAGDMYFDTSSGNYYVVQAS